MTLGAHISAALRACDLLGELADQHAWGVVTGDTRFPDVHDANRALVVGDLTPSLTDVMTALTSMRTRTGVSFEQLEVVDVETHASLHDELTAEFGPGQRFVVMRAEHEPSLDDRYGSFSIHESPAPDEGFWLEVKRAALDGVAIPENVVRQIAQRDLITHFPHGRRLFVARDGDEAVAAVATAHAFGRAALVDDVATLPRQRRRGAATATVRFLMEEARNRQESELFLFAAENGDAQRVYERLGFRVNAVSAQFHRESS